MTQPTSHTRGNVFALVSLGCLVFQAAWVLACYLMVLNADPGNWLAGIGGMLYSAIGCCVLSAVGVASGVAGRRSAAGAVALALNALIFLGTGAALLVFFGPLR